MKFYSIKFNYFNIDGLALTSSCAATNVHGCSYRNNTPFSLDHSPMIFTHFSTQSSIQLYPIISSNRKLPPFSSKQSLWFFTDGSNDKKPIKILGKSIWVLNWVFCQYVPVKTTKVVCKVVKKLYSKSYTRKIIKLSWKMSKNHRAVI